MRSQNQLMWRTVAQSLYRNDRVRLATAVAITMHILSAMLLARIEGNRPTPEFVYLFGFIPIVVLATVTQVNKYGTDRGLSLALLTAPMSIREFVRAKNGVALAWTILSLIPGWIAGISQSGLSFARVVLLQATVAMALSLLGEALSLYAPISRSYSRILGQTTTMVVLAVFNVTSLALIALALRILTHLSMFASTAVSAASCATVGLVLGVMFVTLLPKAFAARREAIAHVLRAAP